MKTTLKTLSLAAVILTVAPGAALAQSAGAAAGAVPNSFDAPASPSAARPAASAQTQAQSQVQAPDIARAEEALRGVIAAAQGSGFDYSAFTPNLAAKIREQSAQVTPLIKSFGAVKTIAYQREEGQAQLFRVTFDNQITEWMIGFDADDKIAALLFRPAQD